MLNKQGQYGAMKIKSLVLAVAVLFSLHTIAQVNNLSVLESPTYLSFPLVSTVATAPLYYDPGDAYVVGVAATAFANDVKIISGKQIQINSGSKPAGEYAIIAGTIGQSKIIDELIKNNLIDVTIIKGQWEGFKIQIVKNNNNLKNSKVPFGGLGALLVISGADPRGTAFGIFHLSRLMGVSPFVWWADVVPQKRNQLFISGSYSSLAPSVKYRGIFINDEDWGLLPWAAKTFEPETGNMGPKTYAKVFELLLRLRANLIWPAMHPGTKAFFTIPGNAKVAADYAIIIGSSHAEPMLRNNVGEWNEKTMGQFNYISNKNAVYKYWEDRVKESRGINAMYSMGMRGVHDSKIEGVKDAKEAVPLLENIIKDQREMLVKHVGKKLPGIPQAFTAYKEVLEIYDNGLKLPDDITLVWPDDNYGYIQRLNNEKEKIRSGGSGVYYHASYWGRPHDYLWISTTHPALIQEEMMKAFDNGSNRLWVLNVGDIKPLEYNIELFMDMAYDARPFKKNGFAKQHLLNWAAQLFGKDKAQSVQSVLWEYYQLAYERRPEFMGWSQTEPTTKTNYSTFNHFFYGDEAQRRIDRYQSLEDKVKVLRTQMLSKDAAAFYQLVYYPVAGASLINKKFLYRDKSYFYAMQNRLSAVDYAQQSTAAYDSIIAETDYFNNQLSGGKWKHMMSMQPRNLPVYLAPELPVINLDRSTGWNIAPEGNVTKDSSLLQNNAGSQLPAFDNLNKQQYFIDLFLTDNKSINWTASASEAWIRLSETEGILSDVAGGKQVRLFVAVNRDKVPATETFSGLISFKAGGKQIDVAVYAANHHVNNFKGFIENNGYVSIHPAHYSRQKKQAHADWVLLPGLGYAGDALQSRVTLLKNSKHLPDTAWIKKYSSFVEYDFYIFSPANAAATIFSVPVHPMNSNGKMRYAVSVDNGPLQVVDFHTVGRSEEWKQNVLRNRAEKKIRLSLLQKGIHHLKIYAMDPGVILDGILIDLGGLKKAYSIIPETIITINKQKL